MYFGFNYYISNSFGYIIGLIISFFLNKYYVFKNYRGNENTYIQFVKFIVIFLIAYAVNIFILYISLKYVNAYLSQFFSMSIYTIVSFTLNKIFTFKRRNTFSDEDQRYIQ